MMKAIIFSVSHGSFDQDVRNYPTSPNNTFPRVGFTVVLPISVHNHQTGWHPSAVDRGIGVDICRSHPPSMHFVTKALQFYASLLLPIVLHICVKTL